ncbi:MAG: carbohydrate-binding family 9-like protein [Bacteroidota bacterium]
MCLLWLLPGWLLAQAPEVPAIYLCTHTTQPPNIDGKIDESAWDTADWTTDFVDIEGQKKPLPYRQTRVKMLWDETYFYVAAEMEEPHLWATYDQRDMVIFHENDFEVFIDPDGDTHNYYELEINALGTIWDLLLTKPYRDGGKPIDDWDIHGLLSAVHCNGSINDPSDQDQGWSVELAFPWKSLEEVARHAGPPNVSEVWRVNFSRVHWGIKAEDGPYQKEKDPQSGKPLAEYNWVWTPQGVIAMHEPEKWGFVQFVQKRSEENVARDSIAATYARQQFLRDIYTQQQAFFSQHQRYAKQSELKLTDQHLRMVNYPSGYTAWIEHLGRQWMIREDGKTWSSSTDK